MFQYFAKIIDGTITGRFRTNQGTAVAETLACQNAVFKVSFESSILTEEIADDLITILKETPGKTELFFQIKDGDGLHQANLKSKSQRISANNKLINYLKSLEGVDYKFN